jgi:drug/metabolite transporter (DMT)-like permease
VWLLVLLVLAWAISWPAVKVGVATLAPLWYGALRYAIGAGLLFTIAIARRRAILPPRGDWPLVVVSGFVQMAAYSALTGLALTRLPAGRASVLAFSTPIWVVPFAAVWLGERLAPRGLAGVALGLLGMLTIAAPSLAGHSTRELTAYALLLTAAAAWAVGIVFVKSHRFTATPLDLAPWQMTIAAGALAVVALFAHGPLPGVTISAAASLAYVGSIGTAFAYWAVIEAGRQFPAHTISMALLATPSLGILISSVTLGESIGGSLVAGVVLIAGGIALATAARVAGPSTHAHDERRACYDTGHDPARGRNVGEVC